MIDIPSLQPGDSVRIQGATMSVSRDGGEWTLELPACGDGAYEIRGVAFTKSGRVAVTLAPPLPPGERREIWDHPRAVWLAVRLPIDGRSCYRGLCDACEKPFAAETAYVMCDACYGEMVGGTKKGRIFGMLLGVALVLVPLLGGCRFSQEDLEAGYRIQKENSKMRQWTNTLDGVVVKPRR